MGKDEDEGGINRLWVQICKYIEKYGESPFVIVNKNTLKDIFDELEEKVPYELLDHKFAWGCPIAICETLDDDVVVLR